MGNAYGLRLGRDNIFAVTLHKRVNGLAAAADLVHGDDRALLVALEHGLDVQHGGDDRLGVGEPSGAAQVHDIVHGEDLIHPPAHIAQRRRRFGKRSAALAHLDGAQHKNALAERGAERIDELDIAPGKLLAQIARGELGRAERAADAGRHADEENVFPGGEQRPRRGDEPVGVYERGRHHRAFSHRAVVRRAVKRLGIKTGVLRTVIGIGKRRNGDAVLLQKRRRQIGGCIGKDSKRQDVCPPSI